MYNHVLAGLSGWFFIYLSYLVMEVKMFLTTSNTTVHVCLILEVICTCLW